MEGQLQVAKVPFGTHGPRNSTEGDTIPERLRHCAKKPKTQFDLDGSIPFLMPSGHMDQ